ncbi:MAG TPA: DUF4350 domain-containing protein [Steroidobacteraceae bacterium]|nr:DUF4350 domain-containing protein [Steroidobacteraceae bacterium]
MRERLITLGCALAALFLFATLFWHGQTIAGSASLPTSEERGPNGLLGAFRWLQQEGVRTVSLRERFGTLARRRDLAPRGNLLLVAMPAVAHFRNDEVVALDRWIRAGNTLLVLAPLSDRPAFAQNSFMFAPDLRLLTGLSPSYEHAPRKAAAPGPTSPEAASRRQKETLEEAVAQMRLLAKPQQSYLVPNGSHLYFQGVARATGLSDFPLRRGTLATPRDGFALALAHDADSGNAAFWARPDGQGMILVSGFASVFSNRALGVADNGRLLANLVAATVASTGSVIFDDEHQGLTAAYDPDKFFRDRRLYATVGIVALVWLVWVLGGTQLKLPRGRDDAPRESELVVTTGLFLARVLRPAAAARRMLEHFLGRVGRQRAAGEQDEARLWDWLEHHPRLAHTEVLQLRRWYADARAERRVPLTRLHNLLISIEGRLVA